MTIREINHNYLIRLTRKTRVNEVHKSHKILLCLEIIKWFFSMFFPRATIILFQVAKKLEKRNGEIVLYFYFASNRQAVYIENES